MLLTKSNLIAERLRIHDTDTVAYILGGTVVAVCLVVGNDLTYTEGCCPWRLRGEN